MEAVCEGAAQAPPGSSAHEVPQSLIFWLGIEVQGRLDLAKP